MSKRKRPQALTPYIRWNAYAREYEKALMAFAREMTKSVSYHALAALRRTDVITSDAASEAAPRDMVGRKRAGTDNPAPVFKATLKELFRRWDKKASELAPKLTEKQLKRLLEYVGGRYKPLLGKDAGKENARIRELMKARYEENIALIRSIPAEASCVTRRFCTTL